MEKIEKMLQKHYKKNDDRIAKKAKYIKNIIIEKKYDFSKAIEKNLDERVVMLFKEHMSEYFVCKYMKLIIDETFEIKYSSRKKKINSLFNILKTIVDIEDFVIVRFDFKAFFDTVSTKFIYEKYIKESSLKREKKDLFKEFAKKFEYCHAGLSVSNAMTELATRDFDEVLQSKLNKYGVIFYARYVDDGIMIFNRYISENHVKKIIEKSIGYSFKKSKVELNMDKFYYISKRSLLEKKEESFNFLGYKIILGFKEPKILKNVILKFGISESKILKRKSEIKNIFLEYSKNKNLELLRHRLKFFALRKVFSNLTQDIPSSKERKYTFKSLGLIDSYIELSDYEEENLDEKTVNFLKDPYTEVIHELNIKKPYFLIKNGENLSIYCPYDNLKRRKTLIFDSILGLTFEKLLKEIKKLDKSYKLDNPKYYTLVNDYMEKIKIERD